MDEMQWPFLRFFLEVSYADDIAAWQATLPTNCRIGKRVSRRARTKAE
jgi:hypothetical protein